MGVIAETAAALPLVRTTEVGAVHIHALEAGLMRLDGGAMFGVVPKPLWEKRVPADDRNRIPMALRCLLIETDAALVLVDTGVGNKGDENFRDIFAVDNDGDPTRLQDAIRAAGHAPTDVDVVVSTHLHFDHAGGNTHVDDTGEIRLSFPAAKHCVQRSEWEFAHRDNERIRAAFPLENIDPVEEAGLWTFLDGPAEIVPGVEVVPTPGHTPGHQSVLVRSEGQTACFLGDVVPTTAHLSASWVMGFDTEPLVTMESKAELLDRARREDWLLVFEHDAATAWGRLDPESGRPKLREDTAA